MELQFPEMGNTVRKWEQFGGAQEDHLDLVNLRNPNGDAGKAVQCVKLEFRGESWVGDRHLDVIGIEMLHEARELLEIVKSLNVDGGEKRIWE